VRGFTVGDVIRKARVGRRWNQKRLGDEATRFPLVGQTRPIDKGTVSKVERDPYGSKFGTVWRLLAALNLTLADAEQQIGPLPRLDPGGAEEKKPKRKSA
jgi:transcriptional regulator with XRE-family HTH domain